MTPARRVSVALGPRSYDIFIGAGVIQHLTEYQDDSWSSDRAFVITDTNVQPHAESVAEALANAGASVDMLMIEPGEEGKCVEVAASLWDELLALGADRRSVIYAVGGGVVGDLAGFVAATYARGLAFVQAPTTLLAQVDSSVGGKVGINLAAAKNMVGAFWQPKAVICDLETLQTLPRREYVSGLGEIVKYGVILDEPLFAFLEQNAQALLDQDAGALAHVIERSCRLKADVVEQDEREETGLRAILNYGHTFAHALETVTGYGHLLHGEAVSIGMACAARLARRLGRVNDDFVSRQDALLTALELPIALPDADRDEIIHAMSRDKKSEHGRPRFILPARFGHVETVDGVTSQEVLAVLAEMPE